MQQALEVLKQIDEAMPFPVAKLAQAALQEALAEQPTAWVTAGPHTVPLVTQPAQQEQGDNICQEDDGCPTELAVLQRFWRGQPIPYEHYPAWCKPAPVPPAHEYDDETEEPCPSCDKALQWRAGGGVVCSAKCGYWFCF